MRVVLQGTFGSVGEDNKRIWRAFPRNSLMLPFSPKAGTEAHKATLKRGQTKHTNFSTCLGMFQMGRSVFMKAAFYERCLLL